MGRVDGVLTWNMGCSSRAKPSPKDVERRLALLQSFVATTTTALVALQEAPDVSQVQAALGSEYTAEANVGSIVTAYSNGKWWCDHRERGELRWLLLGLRPSGASSALWMVNVHGKALNVNDLTKTLAMCDIGKMLRILRTSKGEREDLVLGDFNVPPFDPGIIRAEGLRANRSLVWARTHGSGSDRALFNATWMVLGRPSEPTGTFYASRIENDGPWHAVDQVLVSPALAEPDLFSVGVVTAVGGTLLRRSGHVGAPDPLIGSDHLPLFARIAVG